MSFSEVQRVFIKEKVTASLPGSKIYLFYSCGRDGSQSKETELMIIGERELTLTEKNELRSSLWRILGGKNINIISHRSDCESSYVKYAQAEGIRL